MGSARNPASASISDGDRFAMLVKDGTSLAALF
jgi:hypothetical protein